MSFDFQRPYRESVSHQGLLLLNNQEFEITVRNISINGASVDLQSKQGSEETLKDIFNSLHVLNLVELFLPDLKMAAEAQLVRVDVDSENLLLALEFNVIHLHAKGFICQAFGEVIE